MSVDPLTDKLPSWSPYSAFANNPIVNVDVSGAFPFTFHIRAFAPPGAFDGFFGFGFKDDDRGFSLSTADDVKSRIQQQFTVDTKTGEFFKTSFGTKSFPTFPSEGESKTANPSGTFSGVTKNKTGGFKFGSTFEGSNPFFKGFAPDIEVKASFIVEETNNSLRILANASSKLFPATEAFVTDASGQSVFLGVAPANGSPVDLAFRGKENVFSNIITIGLDDKGNFTNVKYGGMTFSIEDFNSSFSNQNATTDTEDDEQ